MDLCKDVSGKTNVYMMISTTVGIDIWRMSAAKPKATGMLEIAIRSTFEGCL
jgi:hypothetical protein